MEKERESIQEKILLRLVSAINLNKVLEVSSWMMMIVCVYSDRTITRILYLIEGRFSPR